MSLQELRQAMVNIRQASKSWVTLYGMEMSPSFHFTGGEPILRRDLFSILAHARHLGFSVSLLSNGVSITPDIARKIASVGVQDVQVSIDGLEEVHDGIRGEGSFKAAWQGIDNLLARGVDTNINLTVSRVNLTQIEGVVKLAAERGVSAVALSRLVPCGRGREMADQMLTPAELAGLYGGLSGLKQSSGIVVTSRDPLASIPDMTGEVPDAAFPIGGCAAGVFGVTICSDGSIMPCRRMDLSIGNIKTDYFRKLWAESPVLWSLRRRQGYHDGCRSCVYWPVCRGCRAVALAYARSQGREDCLGADPQCPYRRSHETAVAAES